MLGSRLIVSIWGDLRLRLGVGVQRGLLLRKLKRSDRDVEPNER